MATAYCSFCGASERYMRLAVGSYGQAICAPCIAIAAGMLASTIKRYKSVEGGSAPFKRVTKQPEPDRP